MVEMTRDEFYEKYGNVEVEFYMYYKYTFTYQALLEDGTVLSCDYGGNSGEIYRHEVASGDPETVLSLQPYAGAIYKDGETIESFYDF